MNKLLGIDTPLEEIKSKVACMRSGNYSKQKLDCRKCCIYYTCSSSNLPDKERQILEEPRAHFLMNNQLYGIKEHIETEALAKHTKDVKRFDIAVKKMQSEDS